MAGAPRREALFAKLGRRVDAALLDEALTHPSASSPARPDYQRLEFLGDRVLNLVIAEALLARLPGEPEGRLAPRLNALVRKETCAEIAAEIGLGGQLRLERSESLAGGRRRVGTLGDAMEALIGAIHLDQGFEAARETVLRLWGPRIETQEAPPEDAKSALQDWAQARGMALPVYAETERSGPAHALRFTVEVRLADGRAARATGPSKRAAERAAAAELMERLRDEP